MSLINFKDIDFSSSVTKTNEIVDFNGAQIQIVTYLSAFDKYDLIMATLQKSLENGIYNDFKLRMYFDLHLVYVYTNLIFDADDRTDESALYDTLKQSGFIDMLRSHISATELKETWNLVLSMADKLQKKQANFIALLNNLVTQLPERIDQAKEMLKEVDPELLKSTSANSFATLMASFLGTEKAKEI